MPCDSSGSAMTRHKGPDDPAIWTSEQSMKRLILASCREVIWGNSWVMRWRQSRDALNDTLRRLVEEDNHLGFS